MSVEPYASCPCGSGKQFKWCCQSYYDYVEKALTFLERGQKDAALRSINHLVEKHPKVHQAYGYKAQILYLVEQFEQADEALQKAFDLNPNFAYGHYLRGVIRQNEGELVGALLQYRKAAEFLDPKAVDLLAQVTESIGDLELRSNRPVAARAMLEKALRLQPGNQQLKEGFAGLFGNDSRLPLSARKEYRFRPGSKEKAESWKTALESSDSGRLTDAARGFEQLTTHDPSDKAAWFNLGLVRAWLGDNQKAVEALGQSVNLETDEEKATEAAALIEVLRCSHGFGDQTDYVEYSIVFRMTNGQAVVGLLQEWEQGGRLVGVRPDQQAGSISALVLEDRLNLGMGIGNPVASSAAYLFIVQDMFRIWHPNKESLEKVATEIRLKLASVVMEAGRSSGPPQFGDVVIEAMSFPHQRADADIIKARMMEHARQFFEEKWIHRSLRSLSGLTPIDASQSPTYRKRLLGVIRFLEECFLGNAPRVQEEQDGTPASLYDFDLLRNKLGLTATPKQSGSALDFNTLATPELANLDCNTLSDEQLEQGFRAALRLDAQDLTSAFAKSLTARPANATQPDRFFVFNHLIEQARRENNLDSVLTLLDEAEKADQEGNEGKRLNDYSLRRGQTLAKKGQADAAYAVFDALLNRSPDELRYFGPAIESMLGLKQGQKALHFAEKGLAKARSQNNRDSEHYFLELISAAKKQG